jgi:NAD(P)-dependent dehydrogenase (short-subunit alcohol dehydrogenase family)
MTRVLAGEWAKHNIQVNCIVPGFIRTDLNRRLWEIPEMLEWVKSCEANPDIGKPEDVAPLAVFLASRGSNYITGQLIAVDGGFTTTAMWPMEPLTTG